MKKLLLCFVCSLTLIVSGIVPIFANDFDVDINYRMAQSYYQAKKEFAYLDQVLTYESLGLESDKIPFRKGLIDTSSATTLAKSIIALVLHGEDPRNVQGQNFVKILESYVHDNGAVDKVYDETDANAQFMCVNALYVVHSSKVISAADYLASLVKESGAFCYYYQGDIEDLATTAWSMEALSLVDHQRYQETIMKAKQFIENNRLPDIPGGFGQFGSADACTQGSVLAGLLTIDSNKNDYNDEMSVLVSFQNKDGSFYSEYAGGAGVADDKFSTPQGAMALGYYMNGSLYRDAYQEYEKIMQRPQEKPSQPVEKPTQKPNKEQDVATPSTTVQAKRVETFDDARIMYFIMFMILSGLIYVKGRKICE